MASLAAMAGFKTDRPHVALRKTYFNRIFRKSAYSLKKSTMDLQFSMPIHQDPHIVLSIVDKAWAAAKLPKDEITVPENTATNTEEDEASTPTEAEDDTKWAYLGFDQLQAAPNQTARAARSTSVTSTQVR